MESVRRLGRLFLEEKNLDLMHRGFISTLVGASIFGTVYSLTLIYNLRQGRLREKEPDDIK